MSGARAGARRIFDTPVFSQTGRLPPTALLDTDGTNFTVHNDRGRQIASYLDPYTAFQFLLDVAPVDSLKFIKEGEYSVVTTPQVPSGCSLEGEGYGTHLLNNCAGADAACLGATGTALAPLENIHIRNMRIDGSLSTTNGDGITFLHVNDSKVENVWIESTAEEGFAGYHCTRVQFVDSTVTDTDTEGATSPAVEFANDVADNRSVDCTIARCNIHDTNSLAVLLRDTDNCKVIDNTLNAVASGISIQAWDADNLLSKVSQNEIIGSLGYGISLNTQWATGVYVYDATVVDNTILSPVLYGLHAAEAHRLKFNDNLVRGSGHDDGAIYLLVCDDPTVNGNTVMNTDTGDGIHLRSDVNHGVFVANVCSDDQGTPTQGNGIYVRQLSDDNIFVANRCRLNTGFGLNIANANCDENVVGMNNLRGNTAGSFNDAGTNTFKQTVAADPYNNL